MTTHRAAISAGEQGQPCQQAGHHLRAMQRHDIAPEVIPHRAAISAGAKGQPSQQAFLLLRALQIHDIAPDVNTHSAAVSACEGASRASMPYLSYARCSTVSSGRL